MMNGFFDIENRLAKLDRKGDFLARLDVTIDWEQFRPTLSRVRKVSHKSNAGRKPYDEVLMFKILVIQSLYNLSDEAAENMILDRLTFQRFLGLNLDSPVPDATTIWLFRDTATRMGLIGRLFDDFECQLTAKGLSAKRGSMIDASIVEVPRQKVDREERKVIEEKGVVEGWSEDKRRQKDTDAKWTKKNDKTFFGYKNHVCVDVEHKIIRKFEVTDAAVHDSRMAERLLDFTNTSGKVYADSAYRSQKFISYLELLGFSEHICRKGYRGKPLTEAEKRGNSAKSRIRARVEHVFGQMKLAGGKFLVRTVGMARARAKIGLMNLVYNMRRLVTLLQQRPTRA